MVVDGGRAIRYNTYVDTMSKCGALPAALRTEAGGP